MLMLATYFELFKPNMINRTHVGIYICSDLVSINWQEYQDVQYYVGITLLCFSFSYSFFFI
jgi:hypothetical protein